MRQLDKGCKLVMAALVPIKQSGSGDALSIEYILVVREFVDVFTDEIPGFATKERG